MRTVPCRYCGEPIELQMYESGNMHRDCYWKWVHEAFHPEETTGLAGLSRPPGLVYSEKNGEKPSELSQAT